ncbi:MAG: NAD-dependent epimerase/dehydratase family protein [Pirellulaceae bacterium]
MRALITGITGFVGQYLAEHLVDCGDEVIGSTYRDAWDFELAEKVRQSVSLYEWDLRESVPVALRTRLEQWAVDWIFHLAAISVPGECGDAEPSPLATAINVGGTRAVLTLAQSLDPQPRVLAVSSAHVYAPVSPEHPYVTESAPVKPTGAYGITKLQAEEVCREAVDKGLDVVVARAFQHAGPRQLPKFMLPEWAVQFVRPDNQPIQVVTLDSYNDLSDVRDIVRAYRGLLQSPHTRGVYNVGSGRNVRSGDIFDRLVQLTGRQSGVVERQPGRRQHPIADCTRIAADTGWSPRISLDQTLLDTLAYFRARQ